MKNQYRRYQYINFSLQDMDDVHRKWRMVLMQNFTIVSAIITGLTFIGMCFQVPSVGEAIALQCFYVFLMLSFLFASLATVSFLVLSTGCMALTRSSEPGKRTTPFDQSLSCLSLISLLEMLAAIFCFSCAAMIVFYSYFSSHFSSHHAFIALFIAIGACGCVCLFKLCWMFYFQVFIPRCCKPAPSSSHVAV